MTISAYTAAAEPVRFLIEHALREDIGEGDHTTLATLPQDRQGKAVCKIKEAGVLAGVAVAVEVFRQVDASLQVEQVLPDGERVQLGDVAFYVHGSQYSLLKAERLVLNLMQRMSGIATYTRKVVDAIEGTLCEVLDTRKTAPLHRYLDKWAVVLGGGTNHRYGLYDMILIKDNHIDYAGGIVPAIRQAVSYRNGLGRSAAELPIVVECRTPSDVALAVEEPGLERLLLDNMHPDTIREAIRIVEGRYYTEASGGITLENVRAIAEAGVDFVSLGSLTHSVQALDISLKAIV